MSPRLLDLMGDDVSWKPRSDPFLLMLRDDLEILSTALSNFDREPYSERNRERARQLLEKVRDAIRADMDK